MYSMDSNIGIIVNSVLHVRRMSMWAWPVDLFFLLWLLTKPQVNKGLHLDNDNDSLSQLGHKPYNAL